MITLFPHTDDAATKRRTNGLRRTLLGLLVAGVMLAPTGCNTLTGNQGETAAAPAQPLLAWELTQGTPAQWGWTLMNGTPTATPNGFRFQVRDGGAGPTLMGVALDASRFSELRFQADALMLVADEVYPTYIPGMKLFWRRTADDTGDGWPFDNARAVVPETRVIDGQVWYVVPLAGHENWNGTVDALMIGVNFAADESLVMDAPEDQRFRVFFQRIELWGAGA